MSDVSREEVRSQLEEEKLRGEIRRLLGESPWINRLIPTVVPLAAAIIAGAQVWMAVEQAAEADRRTVYDQTIRHCELYLKMAESQLKLADFAIQQQDEFLRLWPNDQKVRIHFLQALLPPREAAGYFTAFRTLSVQSDIRKELDTAVENAKRDTDTAFLTVTTAGGVLPRFQRQDNQPSKTVPSGSEANKYAAYVTNSV